ncbi:bifunctional diaminohydroxyphosphoribosylaminopyrimidine deaminase/5-amino-6-(5-phosphoribosylamino)uracil reductase RibD [Zymobacter palmae]|nr:bifunctional diaminohydroxyphosphoribosylaminopyrimidine deaminase/5-amino-6-(5-phosphoribosylamino)uracil reductase RibD [Zymobacter palmae]
MMNDDHDVRWMQRALQLARRGYYSTMPNPRVGCVLVKNGQCVGEGFHIRAGGPHAEIHALTAAGDQAAGATAYVTLEPCSHHGRTGPCADALIRAGISRLVVAMADPNPLVAGRGLNRCREAGIDVRVGVCEPEAQQLNAGFVQRMRDGRPRVMLKLAMSLDGRTAMANGESQWITGPAARSEVQRLRAASGAIVTGIGSVLQDDSRLTVRNDEAGLGPNIERAAQPPLRVVMDTHLRTPPTARILQGDSETIIVTCSTDQVRIAVLEAQGATVWQQPSTQALVDPAALLVQLADERQCNDVLLEAGATLAGSWWQAGLVDELVLFIAPVLLGSEARPLMALPLHDMCEKYSLRVERMRAIGNDWVVTAVPAGQGNPPPQR